MAPRGRPRKYNLGDARMEVAVEHLAKKGCGFEEKVVRKVAAELLKEYEVEGAWYFIELDNYKLLVEKILEYQEMNDHGGSSGAGNKDESMQDDTPTEQALAVSGEAPTTQGETSDEHALAISGRSPAATAENVSQDDTAEATESDDGQYHLTNEAAEEAEGDERLMLPSPVSDKAIVIRRRRPCYGWISDDDDEPQELLQLTPAGKVDKVISVTKTEENQRKRKSM